MTVAAQTPTISYAENGITTTFAVPFRYNNPADLRAVRRAASGAETELAYGDDFTATAGATDAGGTITVAAAAASGTTLIITRATARAQVADYISNGAFTAESHETALDQGMLVNQEQDVEIGRAVKAPVGEAGLLMAPRAQLEGKALTVAGNRVVAGARVGDPLPVQSKNGTSITLAAADAFTVIETTSNSPVTFTIPLDSVLDHPIGTYFELHEGGTGAVTLAAQSGVTLQSRGNARTLAGQHAIVGVRKMGANRWRAAGDFA